MDFFYKYKTIIFLILFLLFSCFIGFILYSMFFYTSSIQKPDNTKTSNGSFPTSNNGKGQIVDTGKESQLPTSTTPNLLPKGEVSPIANGSMTKTETVTDTPSTNLVGNQSGNGIQYYNEDDGKFYSVDNSGNTVALSDRVFYNVSKVSWANSKDKAVIEYPDGANIVYDFTTEKSVTLPKHWEEFEFSPDSKQIAAKSIGLDPDNRWLTIANADGSNARKVEALGDFADSVYTSWSPNNQSIAMYTKGIDANRQSLYFVGQNNENFKSTVIEGRGFRSLWSADGKTLLYSVYSTDNGMKPMLWAVIAQGDAIGQGRRSLGVETWADKCVFAKSNNVYCAVPKSLEEGSGLFTELANSTDDYLYKISLDSNTKKLLAIPETQMTITNIVVSSDEKTLFFTDAYSKAVHKINL